MASESHTKNDLFAEFTPVTPEEWKAQVEKDLKGRGFETLKWKPYEGFTVEPFYTSGDLDSLEYLTNQAPGEFPYARGAEKQSNNWDIAEYISEGDAASANSAALEAIRMGAQSITFVCNSGGGQTGVELKSGEEMTALLKDIPLEEISIRFKCGQGAEGILTLLLTEAENRGADLTRLTGALDIDPIGELMVTGSQETPFEDLKPVISELSEKMPRYTGITVHGGIFGDSGGSAVQELAFALASGVEYVDRLTSLDLTPDQAAGHMSFSFSVGSDYFMEIAKLRAARQLWALITEKFGVSENISAMKIETVSSARNLTVYDPYTNMLRGTVSAMAATVGGSSSVHVAPLDSAYEHSGEFTRRMARNTQLLLKNESYIDRVADPSAGSYYIENLTGSLASAAWELFLEVEKAGGIIKALKAGFVQDKIEETRKAKDRDLATGRATVLGVNKYPNLSETAPGKVDGNNTGAEAKDSEIRPLRPYRAAEVFEKLRLKGEEFSGNKNVFLLPVGNPAMRTARAGFSANFFGCGGFSIIDKGAFDDLDEGIRAALDSGAKIVVLCSSDKEYPEITPGICEKLRSESPDVNIIIAGNPKEHIDELKSAGVDGFIHVRSDILETLGKYQKAVGIE